MDSQKMTTVTKTFLNYAVMYWEYLLYIQIDLHQKTKPVCLK